MHIFNAVINLNFGLKKMCFAGVLNFEISYSSFMSPIFLRDAVYYKSTTQIVKTYSPCITFYSQMRVGKWNFTPLHCTCIKQCPVLYTSTHNSKICISI